MCAKPIKLLKIYGFYSLYTRQTWNNNFAKKIYKKRGRHKDALNKINQSSTKIFKNFSKIKYFSSF